MLIDDFATQRAREQAFLLGFEHGQADCHHRQDDRPSHDARLCCIATIMQRPEDHDCDYCAGYDSGRRNAPKASNEGRQVHAAQLRYHTTASRLGRYRYDPKMRGPNKAHPFIVQNPRCDKFRTTMAYMIDKIGQQAALDAAANPGHWYFVDGAVL